MSEESNSEGSLTPIDAMVLTKYESSQDETLPLALEEQIIKRAMEIWNREFSRYIPSDIDPQSLLNEALQNILLLLTEKHLEKNTPDTIVNELDGRIRMIMNAVTDYSAGKVESEENVRERETTQALLKKFELNFDAFKGNKTYENAEILSDTHQATLYKVFDPKLQSYFIIKVFKPDKIVSLADLFTKYRFDQRCNETNGNYIYIGVFPCNAANGNIALGERIPVWYPDNELAETYNGFLPEDCAIVMNEIPSSWFFDQEDFAGKLLRDPAIVKMRMNLFLQTFMKTVDVSKFLGGSYTKPVSEIYDVRLQKLTEDVDDLRNLLPKDIFTDKDQEELSEFQGALLDVCKRLDSIFDSRAKAGLVLRQHADLNPSNIAYNFNLEEETDFVPIFIDSKVEIKDILDELAGFVSNLLLMDPTTRLAANDMVNEFFNTQNYNVLGNKEGHEAIQVYYFFLARELLETFWVHLKRRNRKEEGLQKEDVLFLKKVKDLAYQYISKFSYM